MGPGAIDLTIEASGAPTCIQIGVHVLKPAYVHLLLH
jgi:D-xylulose reductase